MAAAGRAKLRNLETPSWFSHPGRGPPVVHLPERADFSLKSPMAEAIFAAFHKNFEIFGTFGGRFAHE
jgi:hypothetical protein